MTRYICVAQCPELDTDHHTHCIISQDDFDSGVECPCGNTPIYEEMIPNLALKNLRKVG
jgi:hypothetical protein